ncbi:MAG TPA: hypothetical protein VHE99_06345 [Gammaproteobacteria bacterium]|nr:hypothetical protein [Gammaproteobacteria bacterium]
MTINPKIQQQIINYLQQCRFRALCDDFLWTIKGSSILSGTYYNKEEFFSKVIDRLSNVLLPGWKMHVLGTYLTDNTFIVEMRGEVTAKNGKDYNNEYC